MSIPVSGAGLAFAVLRSCARFGGPAAAPLERAAATLRARDAVAAEQLAQSAQARLSARVLTLVPIALLLLLGLTDPKVRAAVGTPAGVAVVTLGAVLNLCGALWMRQIIGRARVTTTALWARLRRGWSGDRRVSAANSRARGP